jgi:hypothetical protein
VVAGGLLSFAVDQLRFGTNLFLVATFRHFGPIGRLETDFFFKFFVLIRKWH